MRTDGLRAARRPVIVVVTRMDAVRCVSCGETRWALFSGSFENLLSEPCPACGGEMVVERRRPGTSRTPPPVERRDTAFPLRIDRDRTPTGV